MIVYTLFSTKVEISAEEFLPGSEGVGGRESGWGVGGRNDPNIVSTYK
jgi:hypothetical protein